MGRLICRIWQKVTHFQPKIRGRLIRRFDLYAEKYGRKLLYSSTYNQATNHCSRDTDAHDLTSTFPTKEHNFGWCVNYAINSINSKDWNKASKQTLLKYELIYQHVCPKKKLPWLHSHTQSIITAMIYFYRTFSDFSFSVRIISKTII